jgi:hypothetical protein
MSKELSFSVEYLDAAIAAVGHVDVVFGIDSNAVRGAELPRLVSRFSPRFDPIAVFVNFCNARINAASILFQRRRPDPSAISISPASKYVQSLKCTGISVTAYPYLPMADGSAIHKLAM